MKYPVGTKFKVNPSLNSSHLHYIDKIREVLWGNSGYGVIREYTNNEKYYWELYKADGTIVIRLDGDSIPGWYTDPLVLESEIDRGYLIIVDQHGKKPKHRSHLLDI